MRIILSFCLLFLLLSPSFASSNASLRKAGKFYKQKKYGQALGEYKTLLQKEQDNEEAAFGAGASAYQLKDYTAAEQFFEMAAQDNKNPRTADVYFNLGNTYYRAGDLKKAAAAYRKTLSLTPDDKDAIHNLQLVLNQQQNQQNQNDQNKENQDKDSKNQDNKSQPQDKGKSPQDQNQDGNQQPSQPDQLKQDDAQRVMQMARDNEYKARPRPAQPPQAKTVEKDW